MLFQFLLGRFFVSVCFFRCSPHIQSPESRSKRGNEARDNGKAGANSVDTLPALSGSASSSRISDSLSVVCNNEPSGERLPGGFLALDAGERHAAQGDVGLLEISGDKGSSPKTMITSPLQAALESEDTDKAQSRSSEKMVSTLHASGNDTSTAGASSTKLACSAEPPAASARSDEALAALFANALVPLVNSVKSAAADEGGKSRLHQSEQTTLILNRMQGSFLCHAVSTILYFPVLQRVQGI